jgi:hypothetical protein
MLDDLDPGTGNVQSVGWVIEELVFDAWQGE